MRRWMAPMYGGRVGLALLLVRLLMGTAMLFHGWPKIQDVTAFASHARLPLWLGALAAYTEVVGGLLLVLGLLTPVTALFLAGLMAGAFAFVHLPHGDPFVNPGGASFELAALYLVLSVAFLLMGPGAYSLDALLLRLGARPEPGEAEPVRRRGVV